MHGEWTVVTSMRFQTLLKDPKSKSDWLIAFVAVVTYLVVGNGLAPAQFVPPGCPGSWVRGVGGMTCQCPDGSFAKMVGSQIICGSGQQQPGPQSQIPPGYVSCGRGYCPPGQKCVRGSVCVPQDVVDCGKGVFCAAGQKCSAGGRCLPRDAVDCGQGLFCNSGMVCVGTAECITEAEAARRQSDAQKKLNWHKIKSCVQNIIRSTRQLQLARALYNRANLPSVSLHMSIF